VTLFLLIYCESLCLYIAEKLCDLPIYCGEVSRHVGTTFRTIPKITSTIPLILMQEEISYTISPLLNWALSQVDNAY
jgi:hypothetical protein